ncbi:type VII toxin-antitoxin system MntA family adenylyltransferase antitoxin [Endozoicomonas sp. 2B-B]
MEPLRKAVIISFLRQAYGDLSQGILLFGSHANGTANKESDIDLGILIDGMADPVELWENAQTLASQVNTNIDLIDLRAATTVLQHEVINTGIWLWQQDTLTCDLFELQVMSLYQQLQYDRREILDDLQRRLRNE